MPDVTVTPTLTISATAPSSPAAGDLWWNSAIGIFFVYYDDGSSIQWVTTQPVKYINVAAMEGPAGGDLDGYYPNPVIEDAVALEYPVLRNPLALNDYTQRLASTKWVTDMFASFGLLGQVTSGDGILLTPDPLAGDSTIALRPIGAPLVPGEYGSASSTAVFEVDQYGRVIEIAQVAIPPVASPLFTGTPRAPNPILAEDSTQIATTAWVRDLFDASIPGTYAPINSPVFTGDPRAPSPAFSDDDTSIATTEWVRNLIAFAPGAVIFSGADGFPAVDAVNFFWDNTNNRLGIGTGAPSTPLHVVGAGTITGALTLGGNLGVTGNGSFTGVLNILNATGATAGGVMAFEALNIADFGFAVGSGAPTLSANRGTLYLRTDGPPGPYVNIDGGTTWTPVGGNVNVSDTAPVSPLDGQLWWNSVLGNLFIYYNDGSTTQWVPASAPMAGQALISAQDTIVYQSGNVTLNAGTVDLCNTGPIGAAGQKWEIEAVALIGSLAASQTVASVSIWNGSAYIASGGGVMGWATSNWGVTAVAKTQVTLTGPLTFTSRGTGNSAGATAFGTSASALLANTASYISARRIS